MDFEHFGSRFAAGLAARLPVPDVAGRNGRDRASDEGRQVHFAPRSTIFRDGDPADAVFEVVSGSGMLYKLLPDGRRQVVEILGPGDVFGGATGPLHGVSAEALTALDCTAYARSTVEHSPVLMSRLSARLHAQLRALHDHITLLGCKDATERIATFLLRFVPQRGGYGCIGPREEEDRADLRLTMMRHVIADYLGLTIETVSRSLAWLRRHGVVSISRIDEVHIHDVCELCRLTGTQAVCLSSEGGTHRRPPSRPQA
jgi:CRP/FNR family transcriptional regulator